jgi:hypothetical protein
MEELALVLLPKIVKVLVAVGAGVGGSLLLGVWLLDALMKAGVL